MNYVFLSPHFPPNFKHFVIALQREGVNVLGLGSEPYDMLDNDLRDAMTEYYKVDDMESYDELLRACGYFTFKYGKIDYIESHNEHWLQKDAHLRTDFNVAGFKNEDMAPIKKKSEMKKVFQRADIAVAKGIVVKDIQAARDFIDDVGYPVCAKPDIGVGASNTYKISNQEELKYFFKTKPHVDYIMEEYIVGDIHTFDGIVDRDGKIIFISSFIYDGVLEIVNYGLDQFYHNQRNIPKDLMDYGQKTVREFGLKNCFFHVEFFRNQDGKLIALEINVRPPGGLSLDMFNFGSDIDIYQIYAKMIAGENIGELPDVKFYCGFVGVKFGTNPSLKHSIEQVMEKYGDIVIYHGPMPEIFSAVMGDYSYILRNENLDIIKEAKDFIQDRFEEA